MFHFEMKKTFKDEAEVIALIDLYRRQIDETISRIEHTNRLADRLRDTMEASRITGLRADVETMHREVEWRSGRLETLKEILAELKTLPLNLEYENTRTPNSKESNL